MYTSNYFFLENFATVQLPLFSISFQYKSGKKITRQENRKVLALTNYIANFLSATFHFKNNKRKKVKRIYMYGNKWLKTCTTNTTNHLSCCGCRDDIADWFLFTSWKRQGTNMYLQGYRKTWEPDLTCTLTHALWLSLNVWLIIHIHIYRQGWMKFHGVKKI